MRSNAWQKRRRLYFEKITQAGMRPVCQVGFHPAGQGNPLDLHHMSYDRVSKSAEGFWVAGETDEDLCLLCRYHHQRLHQILDDYRRDYRGWDRGRASVRIIQHLRAQHEQQKTTMRKRKS